jgi:hypothetical protein
MYQQRMHVRLMERSLEDEAALVYEGELVCLPQIGHQVLVQSATSGRMLWLVEEVRHVVGIDGRSLHADLKVRKAD